MFLSTWITLTLWAIGFTLYIMAWIYAILWFSGKIPGSRITVTIGEDEGPETDYCESEYCESERPKRDVICQKKPRDHKGRHRAVLSWEDDP